MVSNYGANGVENCIVVTIISMVEAFEQRKFFYLTLIAQYCRSSVGNDYFWLAWDVSLLDETLVFLLKEDIQQEGFSNLPMRRVFCKD